MHFQWFSIEALAVEPAPWGWEQILSLFNVYISQESKNPLEVYTQTLQCILCIEHQAHTVTNTTEKV